MDEVLKENGYDYSIRMWRASRWGLKFLSWFSAEVAGILPMVD